MAQIWSNLKWKLNTFWACPVVPFYFAPLLCMYTDSLLHLSELPSVWTTPGGVTLLLSFLLQLEVPPYAQWNFPGRECKVQKAKGTSRRNSLCKPAVWKFPGRHDLRIRAFKCKSVDSQVRLLISGHISKTNPSFGLCWKEKRMHVKFFPTKRMRVSGVETQALAPSWMEPPFSSPKGRLKKGGFELHQSAYWCCWLAVPVPSAQVILTDILSSLTCLDTAFQAPDPRAGSMRYCSVGLWVI